MVCFRYIIVNTLHKGDKKHYYYYCDYDDDIMHCTSAPQGFLWQFQRLHGRDADL